MTDRQEFYSELIRKIDNNKTFLINNVKPYKVIRAIRCINNLIIRIESRYKEVVDA